MTTFGNLLKCNECGKELQSDEVMINDELVPYCHSCIIKRKGTIFPLEVKDE